MKLMEDNSVKIFTYEIGEKEEDANINPVNWTEKSLKEFEITMDSKVTLNLECCIDCHPLSQQNWKTRITRLCSFYLFWKFRKYPLQLRFTPNENGENTSIEQLLDIEVQPSKCWKELF